MLTKHTHGDCSLGLHVEIYLQCVEPSVLLFTATQFVNFRPDLLIDLMPDHELVKHIDDIAAI